MRMKRSIRHPKAAATPLQANESALTVASPEPMVRTQIYLSRAEDDFLQTEARRRNEPMAAVIRGLIDERMAVPKDAWTINPMLQPALPDSEWEGHEDTAINHDHYLYGAPKKWIKVKGEWVEAPPLPDDYYTSRARREGYDSRLRKVDESANLRSLVDHG
jgi:hypothetical protein